MLFIDAKQSYLHVNIARTKLANARLQSISDKTTKRHRAAVEKTKIQDTIASTALRDPRIVNRELLNKHELVVQLFTRTRGAEDWIFSKERILNATMSNLYRHSFIADHQITSPINSFTEALKIDLIGSGVGPPRIKRELVAAQPQLINVRSRDLEIGYRLETQGPILTLKSISKLKGRSKGRLFTLAREQQLFDRVTVPSIMFFATSLSSQSNQPLVESLWLNTKEHASSKRSKLMLQAIESFVLQQLISHNNRNITVVADGSLFRKLESNVSYASAGIVLLADTSLYDATNDGGSNKLSQPQQHSQWLNQTLLVSVVPHFDWISSPLEAELVAISAAGLVSMLIQQCFDHHNKNNNVATLLWECWSDSRSAVRSWRKLSGTADEVKNDSVAELVSALANAASSITPKWRLGHPESVTQDFNQWSTYDWCSWYADRLSNLAVDSIAIKDNTGPIIDSEDNLSGVAMLGKQIETKTSRKLKDKAVAISMTELLAFFTHKEEKLPMIEK